MIRFRGFTLLELIAVISVMALLTGAISLSLTSVSRQTTVRNAIGAITDMDRSMRIECTGFNRNGEIQFDLDSGRITRIAHRDGESVVVESYQLPNTLSLEKVWVHDQKNQPGHNRAIAIHGDSQGRSTTYAIAIRPRNIEVDIQGDLPGQGTGAGGLLVVAGLTGQIQECRDETQITDLYESLTGRNAD